MFAGHVVADDNKQLGMDIIVLLDCTGSLEGEAGTDPQRNRLDAAVMLVNLADQHSSVTVVPFTDDEKLYTSDQKGTWWNREFQMSNNEDRKTLCASLLGVTCYHSYHNGTDLSVGLKYVRENVLRNRDTNRRTMLIILSDGRNMIDSNTTLSNAADERTRDEAEKIKNLGNVTIYTVQFGKSQDASAGLMLDISENALCSFTNLKSTALYNAFSEAFADMIGSARKSIPINRSSKSIEINIPNNSVAEVNVVLPQDLFEKRNGISSPEIIVRRDGQLMSENTDYLMYKKLDKISVLKGETYSSTGYDFISLKLLSYHKAGTWTIELGNVDEEKLTDSMTVDVLYNYIFDLMSGLNNHNDVYCLNETVDIEAWYSSGGQKENDANLFRTDNNGQPAIPAIITIARDGKEYVSKAQMTNEQSNQRYIYSFPLEQLRSESDPYQGEYTVAISAAGDDMTRTAQVFSFHVVNHAPQSTNIDLPDCTLFSDNPFGEKGEDETKLLLKLSDYFMDEDDDYLTYSFTSSDSSFMNISLNNDNAELSIMPNPSVEGSTSITITAGDPSGEKAERSFSIKAVSIEKRIMGTDENGNPLISMSITRDNDDRKIEKNEDVLLYITYQGLEELNHYFSAEKFYQNVKVSVSKDDVPLDVINANTEAPSVMFNVGDHDHSYNVVADVSYNDRHIQASTEVKLGNTPPKLKAEVPELLHSVPKMNLDEENKTWVLDLTEYFEDPDGQEDIEIYQAMLDSSEPAQDMYDHARSFLRMIHVLDPYEVPVSLTDDAASPIKKFTVRSAGVNRFRINVKDKDNAWYSDPEDYTKAYIVELPVISSREQLLCTITYVVFGVILLIIAGALFYRLIIRRKWPQKNRSAAYMIAYRDGVQQAFNGNNVWWMGLTGKKKREMSDLFRFRNRESDIDSIIYKKLQEIKIWYIWGSRIVMKVPKKLNAIHIVKMDVNNNEKVKDGSKVKWRNNTSLTIQMKVNDKDTVLKWVRCDQNRPNRI